MRSVVLVLLTAVLGFWLGAQSEVSVKMGEEEFPLTHYNTFTVVVYAHNQSLWCERALRSIFEQDYDHYRVVFIDDASQDRTFEIANRFIVENNQLDRVIMIRNETYLGAVASLSRVVENFLDREVIIPLNAKDWFVSPFVFNRLNSIYQNPDVCLEVGGSLRYPSYELFHGGQISYYASLFKGISKEGLDMENCLSRLKLAAGRKARELQEPISFCNTICEEF